MCLEQIIERGTCTLSPRPMLKLHTSWSWMLQVIRTSTGTQQQRTIKKKREGNRKRTIFIGDLNVKKKKVEGRDVVANDLVDGPFESPFAADRRMRVSLHARLVHCHHHPSHLFRHRWVNSPRVNSLSLFFDHAVIYIYIYICNDHRDSLAAYLTIQCRIAPLSNTLLKCALRTWCCRFLIR